MTKKSRQPIDWHAFEQTMLRQFPVLPKDHPMGQQRQTPSWVTEWMQNLMADGFAAASSASPLDLVPLARKKRACRVFETHRSIILRLPAPPGITCDQIRTDVSPHQVRIRFADGKPHFIPMEKPVNPGKTKAIFQDGILELRLPKSKDVEAYKPIRVRKWQGNADDKPEERRRKKNLPEHLNMT